MQNHIAAGCTTERLGELPRKKWVADAPSKSTEPFVETGGLVSYVTTNYTFVDISQTTICMPVNKAYPVPVVLL